MKHPHHRVYDDLKNRPVPPWQSCHERSILTNGERVRFLLSLGLALVFTPATHFPRSGEGVDVAF